MLLVDKMPVTQGWPHSPCQRQEGETCRQGCDLSDCSSHCQADTFSEIFISLLSIIQQCYEAHTLLSRVWNAQVLGNTSCQSQEETNRYCKKHVLL